MLSEATNQVDQKLIDEAVRRILISEENVTIDVEKLRQLLAERYASGSRDLFSLVKLGRNVVHTTHSGQI